MQKSIQRTQACDHTVAKSVGLNPRSRGSSEPTEGKEACVCVCVLCDKVAIRKTNSPPPRGDRWKHRHGVLWRRGSSGTCPGVRKQKTVQPEGLFRSHNSNVRLSRGLGRKNPQGAATR
jgi:hypothetical protein